MKSLDKIDVLRLAASEESAAHDRLRDIYRQLQARAEGAYAVVQVDGVVCSIDAGWAGQCKAADVVGEIESWAADWGVAL